jgi:hypothetical protein
VQLVSVHLHPTMFSKVTLLGALVSAVSAGTPLNLREMCC